jgi:hypothetical protein
MNVPSVEQVPVTKKGEIPMHNDSGPCLWLKHTNTEVQKLLVTSTGTFGTTDCRPSFQYLPPIQRQ